MKKYVFLMILFLLAVTSIIAQEITDSTSVVIYKTGDSIIGFLQRNMWSLIFIAYAFISEWLGSTGKVKEGSVFAWILNLLGRIIRKQGDIIGTKKAKFMDEAQFKAVKGIKIFAMILLLSGFGSTVMAQSFEGFFRPAKANPAVYQMVQTGLAIRSGNITADNDLPVIRNTWLMRPTVAVVAKAFTYNKDLKQLESSTFNKVGFGIGFQRYEEINGEAYNSLGVNALLLFGSDFDMSQLNFTTAVTVHALKLVDVGIARDWGLKQWLVLTGITYSF